MVKKGKWKVHNIIKLSMPSIYDVYKLMYCDSQTCGFRKSVSLSFSVLCIFGFCSLYTKLSCLDFSYFFSLLNLIQNAWTCWWLIETFSYKQILFHGLVNSYQSISSWFIWKWNFFSKSRHFHNKIYTPSLKIWNISLCKLTGN